MQNILIANGETCLVDNEDAYLAKYLWYSDRAGYVVRNIKKDGKITTSKMHREIMGFPTGMEVDHIDGNRRNNQKSNLRICTKSENMANRGKTKVNTSGYKGVSWDKERGKYSCKIQVNSKTINLGRYSDPKEAAMEYDKAAVRYFGKFAKTNFSVGDI